MLFSVSLAEKLASRGVLSYSLYPGRIPTGIAQSIPLEELKAFGKSLFYRAQLSFPCPRVWAKLWRRCTLLIFLRQVGSTSMATLCRIPSWAGRRCLRGPRRPSWRLLIQASRVGRTRGNVAGLVLWDKGQFERADVTFSHRSERFLPGRRRCQRSCGRALCFGQGQCG